MLDKTLKITAILACISVIGIGIGYEIFGRYVPTDCAQSNINSTKLLSPFNQALQSVQFKVEKTHRDQYTAILLLSVNNSSNRTIPLQGLDIHVVDASGKFIDKCTKKGYVINEFIKAKQKKAVKIVCTHMIFLEKYTGEVNFIASINTY